MRINITVIFTLTFRSEACALVSLGSRRALSHKTNTCLSFIVYPSCRSFLLHRKHSRHRQLHQWPWMAQKHSFPQDGMGIYSTSLYTGNMTRFVGPVLLFFRAILTHTARSSQQRRKHSRQNGLDEFLRLMDSRREQSRFYDGCIQWQSFRVKTKNILYTGMFSQVLEESDWLLDVVCISSSADGNKVKNHSFAAFVFARISWRRSAYRRWTTWPASCLQKLMFFFTEIGGSWGIWKSLQPLWKIRMNQTPTQNWTHPRRSFRLRRRTCAKGAKQLRMDSHRKFQE